MVLLSPSRTIIHSLTIMANNTATQLEEIWDRVGYSPDDRAAQLSTWVAAFKALCENRRQASEKRQKERAVAFLLKLDTYRILLKYHAFFCLKL